MPSTIIHFIHDGGVGRSPALLQNEDVLQRCSDTREVAAQTCVAFRESGRLKSPYPTETSKFFSAFQDGIDALAIFLGLRAFGRSDYSAFDFHK
jgi:hypothetical protein